MDPTRQPLLERYAMRLKEAPDIDQIRKAAKLLIGERDYRLFGPSPNPKGTTVRKIIRADWAEDGGMYHFDIEADAFLQHMVRNIAGVLMAIGRGDQPETWARDVLELRDRALGGVTAPPQGLYLVGVEYPAEFGIPGWREHADAAMELAG